MNIALFGGSFDPFHMAHESIVKKVFETLDIDKLFIVPTYINPFKEKYHLKPIVRFDLLNELYSDNENIEILDYEIKEKRKVPTIETIDYLVSKYDLDTINLIIGADNFKSISKWNDYERLRKMVTFVVVTRNGYEIDNSKDKYIQIELDINLSSTELRDTLDVSKIPIKLQKRIQEFWNKD